MPGSTKQGQRLLLYSPICLSSCGDFCYFQLHPNFKAIRITAKISTGTTHRGMYIGSFILQNIGMPLRRLSKYLRQLSAFVFASLFLITFRTRQSDLYKVQFVDASFPTARHTLFLILHLCHQVALLCFVVAIPAARIFLIMNRCKDINGLVLAVP